MNNPVIMESGGVRASMVGGRISVLPVGSYNLKSKCLKEFQKMPEKQIEQNKAPREDISVNSFDKSSETIMNDYKFPRSKKYNYKDDDYMNNILLYDISKEIRTCKK